MTTRRAASDRLACPTTTLGHAARLGLALLLGAALGCGDGGSAAAPSPEPLGACYGATLFGRPSANTGLDRDRCTDRCEECDGGSFAPPPYDGVFLAELRAWTLLDPPAPLAANPYAAAAPDLEPAVCAVRIEDREARTYRLEVWPSAEEAAARGAVVTHDGACGLCSDLESLAVYAGVGDLTQPVRACGIEGILGGEEQNMACLEAIGFNRACASIWYWNTVNTRAHCQDLCLQLYDAPYHEEGGALNACLQCDEDNSGPVFKAVAGRTRRNSGLATALCRPCAEVRPLSHRYE